MDEVTWVEVVAAHRDAAQATRVHGATIRIGRAWDNDVVVDDPHVAAHHLRIERGDDGRWTAHDAGSVNGIVQVATGRRENPITFAPGMTLRIGQTLVRLHASDEPVAAELPMVAARRSAWLWAATGLPLAIVVEMLETRRADVGEPKAIHYLTVIVAVLGVVAAWSAAWATVGRVFSGRARFASHLAIASAGVLAVALIDPLGDIAAFAASATWISRIDGPLAWIVLGATCLAHLRVLGPRRVLFKASAVAALVVLGIVTQALRQAEQRANYGQPILLERLAPPWTRVVAARDEARFFEQAARLQAVLDASRSSEPDGADDD